MKSDTDNIIYSFEELPIVQLRNRLYKTPKYRLLKRRVLKSKIKILEENNSTEGVE